MHTITLYRDLADLLTLVSDDGRGWRGGYWSSSLFVADAFSICRRRMTELCRPTAEWARKMSWPEPIATWSPATGQLLILDDAPGERASRYLGITYDPRRWEDLNARSFKVSVLAMAACTLTSTTAAEALRRAEPRQLELLKVGPASHLVAAERPVRPDKRPVPRC